MLRKTLEFEGFNELKVLNISKKVKIKNGRTCNDNDNNNITLITPITQRPPKDLLLSTKSIVIFFKCHISL